MSGLLFSRCFQFPLGQIKLREARIEEVDGSRDSDEDLKACGRGLQPAPFTIAVHPQEQGPTYLLVESHHEKVSSISTDRNHRREVKMAFRPNMFVLSRLRGCTICLWQWAPRWGSLAPSLSNWLENSIKWTAIQVSPLSPPSPYLIGRILFMTFLSILKPLKLGGPAASQSWRHPIMCFSKEALASPLTTLPSQALQTEAVKLFKVPSRSTASDTRSRSPLSRRGVIPSAI